MHRPDHELVATARLGRRDHRGTVRINLAPGSAEVDGPHMQRLVHVAHVVGEDPQRFLP